MPRLVCLPTLPFCCYYFSRPAANGRKIIADRSEIRVFRGLLTVKLVKSGAHLHFAHVDENEVHLALQSGEGSLTEMLGSFCQQYARAVNRLRNEKGSLFRPHAHVLLVQREKWLLALGRYIHWIPRLGAQKADSSPNCWNTDVVYRNRQSMRGLVTSLAFRTLSRRSPNPFVQRQAYRAFFDQKPSQDEIDLLKTGSPEDARILGDSMFISDILRQLGLPAPLRRTRWSTAQEDIRRSTLTLIENFKVMCNESLPAKTAPVWARLTTLENVCSKRRAPPLPMIRGLIASHVVTQQIATLRQVNCYFCCRPGTLSAGRRRRYEEKFQSLFHHPYEQLFQAEGTTPATSANGIASDEPVRQ